MKFLHARNLSLGVMGMAVGISLPIASFGSENQLVSDLNNRIETLEQMMQTRLEWGGEIEATYNANQRPPASQASKQDAVVRAHLRPKVEITKRYSLKMDLLFRADAANPSRNTVRLDEAFLKAKVPWVRDLNIRGGKIMYNWGVDAFYNPTDFLNPIDYYDFYHLDKLGVIAVDANYAVNDNLSFDIGVVPIFQPSIVSDPKSRWINYSQFISRAITSRLSLPVNLPSDYYIEFDLAQRAPEFPQPFLRVNHKSVGIDFSLAYTYRYNPAPQVVTFKSDIRFDAINSYPTGKIEGVPYYQQEHLFAADASIPIQGGVVFVGTTFSVPTEDQEDLPTSTQILSNLNSVGLAGSVTQADIENSRTNSVFQGTIGFRRDWARFQAYIQYARIWYVKGGPPASLFEKIGQSTGVNPADVFDFFSGAIIPGLRWNFAKRFWARAGTVLSLKRTGIITDTAVDYEFIDGFKIAAVFNYIDGKEGGLLAKYADNTRFSLNLNMVF